MYVVGDCVKGNVGNMSFGDYHHDDSGTRKIEHKTSTHEIFKKQKSSKEKEEKDTE